MAETIQTKQCSVCKQIKPLDEFYKKSAAKDGHRSQCKECCQEYAKKHYTSGGREYGNRYYASERGHERCKVAWERYSTSERGKKTHRKNNNIYYQKHPNEIRARRVIGHAIHNGKLSHVSKYLCRTCDNQAQEYHHPDYSKPLEIVPLCRKCHVFIHYQGAVLKNPIDLSVNSST